MLWDVRAVIDREIETTARVGQQRCDCRPVALVDLEEGERFFLRPVDLGGKNVGSDSLSVQFG